MQATLTGGPPNYPSAPGFPIYSAGIWRSCSGGFDGEKNCRRVSRRGASGSISFGGTGEGDDVHDGDDEVPVLE